MENYTQKLQPVQYLLHSSSPNRLFPRIAMLKKLLALFFVLATWPLSVYSDVIELTNGDVLNAVISHKNDDTVTIDHPSLGSLTISNSRIAAIKVSPPNQTLEESTENLATAPETETGIVVTDAGLFGTGFLKDWDRNVSLGLNGASGSSNNAGFRGEFKTSYEDDEKRWNYDMYYLFSSTDHETSENRFTANLTRDWFIKDSSWFYFTTGGYDWDQFKDWDHRLRLGGGPGYQYIKTETVELASRQGLNLNYSIFPDGNNELKLEALLGIDWVWQISEKQSIAFHNTVYPALTDLGEYRNVTDFEWKHSLGYYNGLAVKIGFHNEYDSSETDKNNLKYYGSLVWGL